MKARRDLAASGTARARASGKGEPGELGEASKNLDRLKPSHSPEAGARSRFKGMGGSPMR